MAETVMACLTLAVIALAAMGMYLSRSGRDSAAVSALVETNTMLRGLVTESVSQALVSRADAPAEVEIDRLRVPVARAVTAPPAPIEREPQEDAQWISDLQGGGLP